MREYSFRKDGFTFERVSKATARRVFNTLRCSKQMP